MARPPGHSPGGAHVFRAHGAAWRKANAGHVGLGHLKVMSAIEICRTSALGDHVERCEDCALTRVAYNSCRIRHYGFFAGTVRARNMERARQALAAPKVSPESVQAEADSETEAPSSARRCSCCGGRMIIVETFEGPRPGRSPPPSRIRIDTS